MFARSPGASVPILPFPNLAAFPARARPARAEALKGATGRGPWPAAVRQNRLRADALRKIRIRDGILMQVKAEGPTGGHKAARPHIHDSGDVRDNPRYQPAQPLCQARADLPRRVKGSFRTMKWWIMAVTLGIYYITPWIRWERGPNLPDQAVLIDMANRRFFFFMIEIWPHEFYFVAGLLIMAGLGLFLFTSAAGRVWCGYACPQTVWTDLFILVERWVEGDRNARIRLHRQKWDGEKIRKTAVKWTLWFLIGLATGGAWIFYFTDAPTLLRDLVTGQAHPIAYTTMLILTATTFAFGGFAREQMCIYACPWPRIQAAMMDEDTITIAYREWRGEPRGKQGATTAEGVAHGDCIDCMACVNVCPMGIDIRNGQQLACITCGLCIDACNDMMDKIGKPRG